ncbi:hypothetical protein A9404_01780 [Halothiobacillus diazotrophicus]|uniref:Tetratrico peptide repeat group 5 domain-containing protein n=1 Tax=Halothiobacillus diazotrophicus TaxID=1860122 RepID=A0A191ZEI0_9GAMM|nr:hypothetical protein [Halothiobacillus diazotrophicus]ANJ66274.1 hypothetical protein A9404_01780 [Halothiobacillus diazotrophicus]
MQAASPSTNKRRTPPKDTIIEDATIERGTLGHVEQMLRDTLAVNPDQLSAYYALYKLLFRQSRLEEAANVAQLGLAVSARLGRFTAAWQKLDRPTADWADTQSPAHFYLFTLKALSFIRLRQGEFAECRSLLEKLDELDPEDLVGASVIRAYADGSSLG